MMVIQSALHACPVHDVVPLRAKKTHHYNRGWSVTCFEKQQFVYVFRLYAHRSGTYELGDVYLDPAKRSQWYSKTMKYSDKLMRTVRRVMKQQKIQSVWLWTLATNTRAIRLYEKHHFQRTPMHPKRESRIRRENAWLRDDVGLVQMVG